MSKWKPIEWSPTEWPGFRAWCECGIDFPLYGDEGSYECNCGRRYRVKIEDRRDSVEVTVEEVDGKNHQEQD